MDKKKERGVCSVIAYPFYDKRIEIGIIYGVML